MQQSLIISFIAKDRLGIVESIADTIAQHNGNWLESRLAKLGGQFTGIIEVNVGQDKLDELHQALNALSSEGITVALTASEEPNSSSNTKALSFTVSGNDRPSIVEELSTLITDYGASIEELNSYLTTAAWSGNTLFTMKGRATLGCHLDSETLIEKLEAISDDLIVEIN